MTVTMMSPTWYDLLDIEPDASTDEIRAAWKAAVADLDPTDRRFRALSDAASVLLDEDKRAAYDADLAAEEARLAEAEDAEDGDEAEPGRAPEARVDLEKRSTVDEEADRRPVAAAAAKEPRRSSLPLLPAWLLGAVAVLAVAAVAAAVIVLVRGGGSSDSAVITAENKNTTTSTLDGSYGQSLTKDHATMIEEQAADALRTAKAAVVPILSYDYRHLGQDQQRAHAYMTPAYQKKYDPLFAEIKGNAPALKAIVKTNPPLDAGIVRVSGDRVQVLLFVDRPTTNKKQSKPIPYQDYVTLTMVDQGGRWLVDDMATTPVGK